MTRVIVRIVAVLSLVAPLFVAAIEFNSTFKGMPSYILILPNIHPTVTCLAENNYHPTLPLDCSLYQYNMLHAARPEESQDIHGFPMVTGIFEIPDYNEGFGDVVEINTDIAIN